METLTKGLKGLGEIAIHNFKAIDPESLEGTSNPLYDPVKYRIAGISNLVNCIIGTGNLIGLSLNVSPGASANSVSVVTIDLGPAWGTFLVNSINANCRSILASELVNKLSKGATVSGDLELAFSTRHNLEDEFGIIIEMANKIFHNKDYQTKVELIADPDSEEWETLVFRFYLRATVDELVKYQRDLTESFVSEIESGKRAYFSLNIEPI